MSSEGINLSKPTPAISDTAPAVTTKTSAESTLQRRVVIDANSSAHRQGVTILSAQTERLAARENLREAEKTLAVLECTWARIDKTKTDHDPQVKALAEKVFQASKRAFTLHGDFTKENRENLKASLHENIIVQRRYVAELHKSMDNATPISDSEKEVEVSIQFAKKFINPPDPKNPGETLPTPREIANLKPGEFVTLSRRGVLDQTGKADLPRSVDIIKTGDDKNPYVFLVHQHAKTLDKKSVSDQKKELHRGGVNRILQGELYGADLKEGSTVIRRVPIDKNIKEDEFQMRQLETEKSLNGLPHMETAVARAGAKEEKPEAKPETKGFLKSIFKKEEAQKASGGKNIIKGGSGGIYPTLQSDREFLGADNDADPKAYLKLKQPLPATKQWVTFSAEECRGYATLHALGIIHMDGSQKNIGVDSNGHPVIRDFDTALHLDGKNPIGTELEEFKIEGTKMWFPPEIAWILAHNPELGVHCQNLERMVPLANGETHCNLPAEVKSVKDALDRLKADKAGKGPERTEAEKNEDLHKVQDFYKKVDCYVQASNLYLKMTGSVPPFTMDILNSNKFEFKRIENMLSMHAGDPATKAKMEAALAEANTRGWPENLTKLVMRGLSPVPGDRPSMEEMAQAFEEHAQTLS